MSFLPNNLNIVIFAFFGGLLPSLLWLWFWLKEEERPEPQGLLTVVFILGMLAVMLVLPIEKFIQDYAGSNTMVIILCAATEEIMKYLAVLVVLYRTDNARKPIDWPIYLITAALGFAALENTLFLLKPLTTSASTVAILAATSLDQLRFIGANLLHTITSGTIGIVIGLSFFMKDWRRRWFLFFGFLVAIALHSAFNFFIMRNNGNDFLKVFAFLWVVTIIIMLLFEKVRRMSLD